MLGVGAASAVARDEQLVAVFKTFFKNFIRVFYIAPTYAELRIAFNKQINMLS